MILLLSRNSIILGLVRHNFFFNQRYGSIFYYETASLPMKKKTKMQLPEKTFKMIVL
jgi:hypothetical protein